MNVSSISRAIVLLTSNGKITIIAMIGRIIFSMLVGGGGVGVEIVNVAVGETIGTVAL